MFALGLGLTTPTLHAQQNVLLIIADDLGVDNVGVYAEHPDPANTPVIDLLAQDGMLFRSAYADPICTPTRSTIFTGRHGYRTLIGTAISQFSSDGLPAPEVTLAEALAPSHRTALVGKWHLGNEPLHPMSAGFEHHRGTMGNILSNGSLGNGYFSFEKSTDGVLGLSTTYATTDTVNDALDLIADFQGSPWFVTVSFNAAHKPIHKPPQALHTYTLPPDEEGNEPIHVQAMIEAMDTEIGRLLASLSPADLLNTTIIFVGDNGPASVAVTPPWDPDKVKRTLYEGGVRVPLIVYGPGVQTGSECKALVNSTDLFATVADLAGAPHETGVDSISLLPYFNDPEREPLRAHAFTERFVPNFSDVADRQLAVRNARFKLIRQEAFGALTPPGEMLFDLEHDPFEDVDLLQSPLDPEAQASYIELAAYLDARVIETPPGPWTRLGGGTVGSAGGPRLEGLGTLQPGTIANLRLSAAPPNSLLLMSLSLDVLPALLAGGGLIANPPMLQRLFVSDGVGQFEGSIPWPAGFESGTGLWFQFLVADPSVVWGFTLSNSAKATTP